MQFPGGRIRESAASKAVRSVTPLLRCHQPIDTADAQLLMRAVDEFVTCHGLPTPGLWFGGGGTAAIPFVTLALLLIVAFVLNALVLWLLHVGRIRLTDFGVIGVCANAIADLALTLNYLINDYLVPLLPSSAQQAEAASAPVNILEALSPALLCRFRMYIGQSCLSMNILVVASLALFAGRKVYEKFVGSAPCGIFMFPSLLAFLALGANIWFLVLCECRMLAFGYAGRLTVTLPVLLTEQAGVGWALLGLSAGTQLLPICLAGYCLWRNCRPRPADQRSRRLLRLTGCLCAAHALCLPQTVLLTAYFAQPPASQRGSLALLLLGLSSGLCTALMLFVKPTLYLLLHPDIRLAFQRRVLRRGGADGIAGSGVSGGRSSAGGLLRQQDSLISSFAAPVASDDCAVTTLEASTTAEVAPLRATVAEVSPLPPTPEAEGAEVVDAAEAEEPDDSRHLLPMSMSHYHGPPSRGRDTEEKDEAEDRGRSVSD